MTARKNRAAGPRLIPDMPAGERAQAWARKAAQYASAASRPVHRAAKDVAAELPSPDAAHSDASDLARKAAHAALDAALAYVRRAESAARCASTSAAQAARYARTGDDDDASYHADRAGDAQDRAYDSQQAVHELAAAAYRAARASARGASS